MATEAATSSDHGIPRPGDTIDGKYALIRVLGTGGMGVVFEAEHLRLKQRCAIKMLSAEMLLETEIVQRFEREARASALLKSPHVTRVTDVATTANGVPYIVMELLAGHDLDGELQTNGRVPHPQAVDYLLQACAAVAEAHAAGIIHRDLKPGNLFLANEQERVIVKVLDFGISKMIEEDTKLAKLTGAHTTMGTALYMSPEQLRSAATVDARSDIWSLGIILYELVCGEPPFVGTATRIAAAIVSEDAPDITKRCPIPMELATVIHRTLRRDPNERFPSIVELAAALLPFAPADSLGAAVAAQLLRRASARNLPVSSSRGSDPQIARGQLEEARTVAHDVSTSVAHAVNTAAPHAPFPRRRLSAALVGVAIVAIVGATATAIVLMRQPTSAQPAAAAGSAPGSATATSTAAAATTATTTGATEGEDPTSAATPASASAKAAMTGSAARPTAPASSASPSPGRPVRGAPSATVGAPASARPSAPARPGAAPSALGPAFL